MSLVSILLQAAGGQSQWSGILMMVVIVAIFYFFMIRPQQKKQKEIRKFRDSITVGDNVVTAGGIYGRVRRIDENRFSLEIARDVVITVDKGSVYPSAADVNADQTNANQGK